MKYRFEIFLILYILFTISLLFLWNNRYVPELFFIFTYGFSLFLLFIKIFEKSNQKKIVIKTKNINWASSLLFLGAGIVGIYLKPYSGDNLIFGFLPDHIATGLIFIFIGIANLPNSIIIEGNGIRFSRYFAQILHFSTISEVIVENNKVEIFTKTKSYQFNVFELTKNEIDLIHSKVNELLEKKQK